MVSMKWNCRVLEVNGERDPSGWVTIQAMSPEEAAQKMCGSSDMWEWCNWEDGDSALVEVEEQYGERLHRMTVYVYETIYFQAEVATDDYDDTFN